MINWSDSKAFFAKMVDRPHKRFFCDLFSSYLSITKTKLAYLFPILFLGCVTHPEPLTTRNSALTQGNVQMNIKTGSTTKAQVLEVFGAPNVTTRDGQGLEVWTYQRQAQVSQGSRESGYTIFLAARTKSGFESSSRMITLIIKFDNNDIVSDFNSRTSNF